MPEHTPKKGTLTFVDAIDGQTKVYDHMVEIAPGVWAGAIPPEDIPPVGFHSWIPLNDGSGAYRPVVRTFQQRLQLTKDIGKYLGVGLPDTKETRAVYMTIRRLIMSGFVKARQIGPGSIEVDLLSFWQHYQRAGQPGFWNKENRRRYHQRTRGTILPTEDDV
jgi:hypothetical protein